MKINFSALPSFGIIKGIPVRINYMLKYHVITYTYQYYWIKTFYRKNIRYNICKSYSYIPLECEKKI